MFTKKSDKVLHGYLLNNNYTSTKISNNFLKSSTILLVNIGIRYILQLSYLFFMAKMIQPDVFGVVALASPIVSFLTLFSVNATGFLTMHKKQISREDIDNYFWVNMIFSFILYTLVIALTPLFSRIYHDQRLLSIIPILGTMFLISPLVVQGRAILDRNLKFNKATGMETIAILASYIVSVIITYQYRNYIGLVMQQVLVTLTLSILLMFKTGWFPRLPQKKVILEKKDFSFVRNITISKVSQFINANIDKLLMGYFYGFSQLGYYNNALKMNVIPIRQIRIPFSSFVIPSMIRNDKMDEKLTFFYNSIAILMLATFPLISFFVFFASKIVVMVLGEQWIECVDIIRIMGVYSIFTTILPQFEWFLISMKKDRKQKWINVISTIINVLMLVFLTRFEFKYFIIGYSMSAMITFAIYFIFMIKEDGYSILRLLQITIPILLVSQVSAVIVYMIMIHSIMKNLIILFPVFIIIYLCFIFLIPMYRKIVLSVVKR